MRYFKTAVNILIKWEQLTHIFLPLAFLATIYSLTRIEFYPALLPLLECFEIKMMQFSKILYKFRQQTLQKRWIGSNSSGKPLLMNYNR